MKWQRVAAPAGAGRMTKMPFTAEQFSEVFARYNQGVWPLQFFLSLLALAILALVWRGRAGASRAAAVGLSLLWAWAAVAYHFTYFTAINPAAWLFGALFLAGAGWFGWVGGVKGRLRFGPAGGGRGLVGGLLVAYALVIYPLLGLALGHRYPATPTFGLPCPTTIFTTGVLLFAAGRVPSSVFVAPLLWAAVGSFAAFRLGVLQDLGLLAAGLAAAAILAPTPVAPAPPSGPGGPAPGSAVMPPWPRTRRTVNQAGGSLPRHNHLRQ